MCFSVVYYIHDLTRSLVRGRDATGHYSRYDTILYKRNGESPRQGLQELTRLGLASRSVGRPPKNRAGSDTAFRTRAGTPSKTGRTTLGTGKVSPGADSTGTGLPWRPTRPPSPPVRDRLSGEPAAPASSTYRHFP